MIIMGLDPGIATTGYSLINHDTNKFKVIDYGAIITAPNQELSIRLLQIYNKISDLIVTLKPDVIAIEELFFNKNIKTALMVGHGRGIALLAGASHGIPVYEYTPLQVKQSVVGYGRAEKKQVQNMVKVILNLEQVPKPDDVADAIAVAICHAHSYKLNQII